MRDQFGREMHYLRISLTDRCNLRCSYCMPPEGIPPLAHEEILRYEEILRIVRAMVPLGIRKIRLTGGEPLIRRGVPELIAALGEIEGIEEIALTTNGLLLYEQLAALQAAGLHRLNISLDTLNQQIFRALTGQDGLQSVLAGIEQAYTAGLPVKINCVPLRGINADEIPAIAGLARHRAIDVRFIELMPLGCARRCSGIPSGEILQTLTQIFGSPAPELRQQRDSAPAEYFRFSGFRGKIGLISPLSHRFCQHCDRLRLTAEGYLKLCLQYPQGVSLRNALRRGCAQAELQQIIQQAVLNKPAAHTFNETTEILDTRRMAQIGG